MEYREQQEGCTGRRKIHGDRAQTHREAEAFFWNGYDPGSASDNRDHDRWSDDP